MIFSVENFIDQAGHVRYECKRTGRWRPARPLWSAMGRWRHAWWVFTGRCDAIWWPENGNPYTVPQKGLES